MCVCVCVCVCVQSAGLIIREIDKNISVYFSQFYRAFRHYPVFY